MVTKPKGLSTDEIAHRELFGRATKNWFKQASFSQEVPHAVAQHLGLNGPWNSQMSQLFSARLEMKSQFWVSLARFNQIVDTKDFTGISDQKLRERLAAGVPFRLSDGKAARACDFFGMFVGEIEIPECYTARIVMSADEARQMSGKFKATFEREMREKMMTRAELFKNLCAYMDATQAEINIVREVLIGEKAFTPDELEALQPMMSAAIQKAEIDVVIG